MGLEWPVGTPLRLRFAAKGDVIVEIDQIEPGLYVFAFLGKFPDIFGEVLQRFDVTAWTTARHEGAPGIDFPRGALVFLVGVDPFQDFPVALPGRELFL